MSPFTVRAGGKVSNSNITPSEKTDQESEAKLNEKEKSPSSSSWTIEGITQRNLEPTITHAEHKEYKRFVFITG